MDTYQLPSEVMQHSTGGVTELEAVEADRTDLLSRQIVDSVLKMSFTLRLRVLSVTTVFVSCNVPVMWVTP